MNSYLILTVVPLGYADKVINAANVAGAKGATMFRARGADNSVNAGLFSFKVEPEEEIVLIAASKEVTDIVCAKIHEEFDHSGDRSGTIYVIPLKN